MTNQSIAEALRQIADALDTADLPAISYVHLSMHPGPYDASDDEIRAAVNAVAVPVLGVRGVLQAMTDRVKMHYTSDGRIGPVRVSIFNQLSATTADMAAEAERILTPDAVSS